MTRPDNITPNPISTSLNIDEMSVYENLVGKVGVND